MKHLLLALVALASPALAQTPTLANSKGEVARVSGKPAAEIKTWAQWWSALRSAPNYVAPPPRDPWDETCTLNVGDAYALSDARQAIVQATITNQYGEPCTRSFSFSGVASNAPGFGQGYWQQAANVYPTSWPSRGSKVEWILPLNEPQRGRVGRFPFFIQNIEGLGQKQVWINIVDEYPAGVKAPVSFGDGGAAKLVLPTRAPDLSGDFIADWKEWETVSFSVNGQMGWSVTEGVTTTRSGAKPNPYRIETVDGRPTRVLRPVDQRNDPFDTKDGVKPWAVGGVRRKMPDVSGIFRVTVDFGPANTHSTPNAGQTMNNAWWHWIASRPVEQDNHEHFAAGRDSAGQNRFPNVTYHENSGDQLEAVRRRKISFRPFGNKLSMHTIVRVRSVKDNVLDYYVDGVKVIEAQNIGLLNHWYEMFYQEGPGGSVAGQYDPNADYSRSTITLKDWAWWTLKPTDKVR